jgi:DNA-binding transcriptional MerR regulator
MLLHSGRLRGRRRCVYGCGRDRGSDARRSFGKHLDRATSGAEPFGRTEEEVQRLERILRLKGIGYRLAAIRELLTTREEAQEADKITIISNAMERLRDREREVTERIQQVREDLKRAEALREELRRDIALCERRIKELGDQSR